MAGLLHAHDGVGGLVRPRRGRVRGLRVHRLRRPSFSHRHGVCHELARSGVTMTCAGANDRPTGCKLAKARVRPLGGRAGAAGLRQGERCSVCEPCAISGRLSSGLASSFRRSRLARGQLVLNCRTILLLDEPLSTLRCEDRACQVRKADPSSGGQKDLRDSRYRYTYASVSGGGALRVRRASVVLWAGGEGRVLRMWAFTQDSTRLGGRRLCVSRRYFLL